MEERTTLQGFVTNEGRSEAWLKTCLQGGPSGRFHGTTADCIKENEQRDAFGRRARVEYMDGPRVKPVRGKPVVVQVLVEAREAGRGIGALKKSSQTADVQGGGFNNYKQTPEGKVILSPQGHPLCNYCGTPSHK